MLSSNEKARYARHLSLAEVGEIGQEGLQRARVLVVGAGGLGCPVLQYLTAAGVGTIGIIDDDQVDESNLQRQVLYTTSDVGQSKVHCAIERLSAQNPYVSFEAHAVRLTRENATSIIESYDFVIDGTDNFPTRYLVNDACIIANRPLVFGSIFKFEGQLAVFNYKGGPSYRCLYPTPPKEGEVPNCSEIGVLGALPGVIGTRMAIEAIKMILEIGDVLSSKLEIIDLLNNRNTVLSIDKNEENFARTSLEENYALSCEIQDPESITPKELKARLDQGEDFMLIDVREPFEIDICSLEGALNIPLGEVESRFNDFDSNLPKVFICHHGIRSAHAIRLLEGKTSRMINLSGGIHEWALTVDPEMRKY